MNIEDQVVSLKLSQKLKVAGYKQEGLFYWCPQDESSQCYEKWQLRDKGIADNHLYECFIAPTCSELGESLPSRLQKEGGFIRTIKWSNNKYEISVGSMHRLYADTEANARAKMWLYLKKENLL